MGFWVMSASLGELFVVVTAIAVFVGDEAIPCDERSCGASLIENLCANWKFLFDKAT